MPLFTPITVYFYGSPEALARAIRINDPFSCYCARVRLPLGWVA